MTTIGEPGQAIGRDIGAGERAEAELDGFISRRDKQRRETKGERAVEDLWKARERLEEARRRDELTAEKREWWRRLEAVYAARSRECGRKADELQGDDAA